MQTLLDLLNRLTHAWLHGMAEIANLPWYAWLAALVIVGAFSQPRTVLHYFAVGVDLLGSIVFLRLFGVTISSWAGLAEDRNRMAALLVWALNDIETDHCTLALEADTARALIALKYLTGRDYVPKGE